MDTHDDIKDLISFLKDSPTSWHAVDSISERLERAQFVRLVEEEKWELAHGGKYYVTRNGSSLCAFIIPHATPPSLRLLASHTDSPGFKLKPHAEYKEQNMILFGIEPYGSPLITSWLNRDLGIAGRVAYTNQAGSVTKNLVCIEEYPLTIPQCALHLSTQTSKEAIISDKQKNLIALAALDTSFSTRDSYLEALLEIDIDFKEILSHDLFLFPIEKPRLIGNRELLSAYRIDNLASAHASLQAITKANASKSHDIQMAVFFNDEEIGSRTTQGAASPFLAETIERVTTHLGLDREELFRLKSRSLCASVDVAHGYNPAYPDGYEPHHTPLMDKGIVIKSDAQQRYASDCASTAIIKHLCNKHSIAHQHYINHGNMSRGGSTIGPIIASTTGIATVDIGETTLSMHSCREVLSCVDHISMCALLDAFLADEHEADKQFSKMK